MPWPEPEAKPEPEPKPEPSAASSLSDWLAELDALPRASAELSLERTQEVRRRLGLNFDVPLVVVAGTNGKGSSCAMLESIARHAGYRTGLYQKPELVRFEERCQVNGQPVEGSALVPHFAAVQAARGDIVLNRFEFTTLAIARCLAHAGCDVVILEVGMGGRFDAVNAFDADAVLITSIDLDHMQFLGPDRESIGFEKAGVMRPGRPAIVSDPLPPASVLRHAQDIGADLWLVGRDFRHSGDRQQWGWSGRQRRFMGMAYPALRGANQLLNASGVLAVFEALRERLPITAQAVRTGLALVELPGRFQVVPGQPALVLDVAHNAQSAAALALNLDAMGFFPRTLAVFGAMADKALPEVLAPLRPLVEAWFFCDLKSPRAAAAADLCAYVPGSAAQAFANPGEALRAALAAADPVDRIVVFGSFLTVGGVLKEGWPERTAPHAG
jgi:dihydrofolate synthase / folylpolyglutamate synthase